MRVLIACEESQEVCKAFRARGHAAYSCDIQECSGGHPEWHLRGDALAYINGHCLFQTQDNKWHYVPLTWDIIIAHPPCTNLANSGARWFAEKKRDGRQQKSIDFFMQFVNADCDKIAIENPIGIMSSTYRKPDQIIQPWMFALSDDENTVKSTCLWLTGLPPLSPTHSTKPEIEYFGWTDSNGRTKRQTMWYYKTRCLPHKERAAAASKTFPGIAKAMAEQWG